jgi:hypothetical protein
MIRRAALWDRAHDVALIALVLYVVAFYAFDLPDWLKLAGGIVLGAGWLAVFVGLPILRSVKRSHIE